MKRKGVLILFAVLALILSSMTGCRRYEQIIITSGELESVSMNGFKSVDLVLIVEVDNPAGKVFVNDAEGVLKHFGKVVGRVTLAPLVLKPRTTEKYHVSATVQLEAGIGFKELMTIASPSRWGEYPVDVNFSGKASGVNVKRKFNDIPLKKLLESKRNEEV